MFVYLRYFVFQEYFNIPLPSLKEKEHSNGADHDDNTDDEDKCVYVVRKCVWEYGSHNFCLCVSVYVLSFVGKIRKMCQLFSSSNHLHTCTHTFYTYYKAYYSKMSHFQANRQRIRLSSLSLFDFLLIKYKEFC